MEENTRLEPTKTQTELIGTAFKYINSFKRHRALANIKKFEGQLDKSTYHKMKTYELFDNLELTLRAIQKGQRDLNDTEDDTEE